MTEIYIARHGETEYNRKGQLQGRGIDIPLNEKGRLQARAIAEELSDLGIDHIFSSSLLRSMETAEIIAWTLRMRYDSFPELDEMSFGELEGRPAGEVGDRLERMHQTWKEGNVEAALEGGESPAEVLERVTGRVNKIVDQYEGDTLLFVLHGRLIRILLSHMLGYGLPEMHRIEHSTGALYHLRKNEKGYEPVYLTKTDHLEGIEAGS